MKFENTETFNFEGALRGMRNPMNSHDKSDSGICKGGDSGIGCSNCATYDCGHTFDYSFQIGKNDLELAQKLIKGGSEHRKFLRQVFVSVDITTPRYIWAEFDTYSVGVTKNSCSTIHKLKDYPITEEMFGLDYIDEFDSNFISHLDTLRCLYNKTKDIKYFRKLKQLLPESFLQKRTVTFNYEVLRNIYFQRRKHKLSEWSEDFVEWIKSLPYAKELIMYRGEINEK